MTNVTDIDDKAKFVAELKLQAKGKWADILAEVTDSDQLAEAYAANGTHVACPVHGGTDGFRLYSDFKETGGTVCNTCKAHPNGLLTLAWLLEAKFGKNAYDEACYRVSAWLGGKVFEKTGTPRPVLVLDKTPKGDPVKAALKIRAVWKASLPLKGSAGETYLRLRGIYPENISTTLRFHPGLPYWDTKLKKELGVFPCLLAPIRNKDNKIVSIHRIFLTEEGLKAPVPSVKKMMEKCDELVGSAIKLFEPTEILGIAEGIETALAAHAISRMPVWASVTAALMEQVIIPASVKLVVIWADKDISNRGIEAAEALATRLEKEGKQVLIYVPVQPIPSGAHGIDWLDVLINYGLNGFPARWRCWRPDYA